MNVLSLFNGISCGRVAFERANIKVERYISYEIDKYANMVAKHNFPNDEYCGDVTTEDFTKYKGQIDIVIGGSPCTYWSIAKKDREVTSEGIGYELFKHFVRAIKETEAKYFLYENNYSIHKDIKAEITKDLGVDFIMINSALVSAQQRKRCYWTNIPNVTQPQDRCILLQDILESDVDEKYILSLNCLNRLTNSNGFKSKIHMSNGSSKASTVLASQYKLTRGQDIVAVPVRVGQIGNGGQAQRVYSVNGKSVSLKALGGEQGANTGLYKIDLPDGDYIIRKLTPIESERLQCLCDNYSNIVSDTQRYKGVGNGWTVDVVVHILKNTQ